MVGELSAGVEQYLQLCLPTLISVGSKESW
ncbi:hypothetical protein FB563_5898 [Streptomyces puniciscabiei]|uniref:Uncharacterized protein n=1 Tax=Streptomyces puniciscabiei TaxID=164348 RepID=A0A542UNX2_9ACTN|nr:hypothetical protein FB563_5898 [Streptomyces puniciscabiei]